MFSRLRQTDLEDEMMAAHGFSVGVQRDYVKVQDTTVTVNGRTGTFIRFRRVLVDTWRDFFVFAQDGVDRAPAPSRTGGAHRLACWRGSRSAARTAATSRPTSSGP